VFSKSKIFKFLKRDCGTIPVAEIINGKIEIFSKDQRFLIATESSKYLLIMLAFVVYLFLNKLTFTDKLKRFAKTLFKDVRHHLYDIK
jgi:hypothetical protein